MFEDVKGLKEQRHELMRLLSRAESPSAKQNIERSIKKIDAQVADAGSNDVFDALSYPQRKLKEAISGDELEWFSPEGMPVWAYAGLNTALDIAVDPIDLVTLGLGKGAKALRAAAGIKKGAGKGMFAASASNYVDDYYGLGKAADEATKTEKLLMPKATKAYEAYTGKSVPDESQLALLRKGKGMAKTLVKGAYNGIYDTLNPLARAGWKEGGYSASSQRIVERHLNNIGTEKGGRAVQKAMAQTQYVRYIGEQAERIGDIDPTLFRLTDDMSNLKTAVPNEQGTVAKLMQEHPATEVVGRTRKHYGEGGKYGTRKDPKTGKYRYEDKTQDYVISDADAAYIDKHVNNVTGNPDVLTVKRAEQLNTGKHKFDVLGNKNHGYRAIEKAFKSHFPSKTPVTMDSLYAALQDQMGVKGAKKFSIEMAEDGSGIWVTNGTNASAITEGGINSLIKTSPDGQLMGIMSDRHDWLEKVMAKISRVINKIPGANVNLEKAILPKSLAGVTPPMYKNVYDTTLTQKALAKNKRKPPSKRSQPNSKITQGSDYATVNQDEVFTEPLREYVSKRASDAALGGELLADAQKGVGLFGSIGNRLPDGEDSDRTAGGLPIGLMNPEEQEKQEYLRQNLQTVGDVRGKNAEPFFPA